MIESKPFKIAVQIHKTSQNHFIMTLTASTKRKRLSSPPSNPSASLAKVVANTEFRTTDDVWEFIEKINPATSRPFFENANIIIDGIVLHRYKKSHRMLMQRFPYLVTNFDLLGQPIPDWLYDVYRNQIREIRYNSDRYQAEDNHRTYTVVALDNPRAPIGFGRTTVFVVKSDETHGWLMNRIYEKASQDARLQLLEGGWSLYSDDAPTFSHISEDPNPPPLPPTTLLRDTKWSTTSYQTAMPPIYTDMKLANDNVLFCNSTSVLLQSTSTIIADPHYKPFHVKYAYPFEHFLMVMDGNRIVNGGRMVTAILGDAYTLNNPMLPLCGREDFANNTLRFDSLDDLRNVLKDTYGTAIAKSTRSTRRGSVYGVVDVPKKQSKVILGQRANKDARTLLNIDSMSNEVVADVDIEDVVGICLDAELFNMVQFKDICAYKLRHKTTTDLHVDFHENSVPFFLQMISRMAQSASRHFRHNPFHNIYVMHDIVRNDKVIGKRVEPLRNARSKLQTLWKRCHDTPYEEDWDTFWREHDDATAA